MRTVGRRLFGERDEVGCIGLHGILADEMGLGKTVQTIALLAHLREKKGKEIGFELGL